MSKPQNTYRPIAPLDVADSDLDRVNEKLGVPIMIKTRATGDAVATQRRPDVASSRRQQKLTIRIPVDLADELKRRAIDDRTSVRQLVLLALQHEGYEVRASDLLPGAGGSG